MTRNTKHLVIFSPSEGGFYGGEDIGWTDIDSALVLNAEEAARFPLPDTRMFDAELREKSDFARTSTYMTDDGCRLSYDPSTNMWTDGDLSFPNDEKTGLPMDEEGFLLSGAFLPEEDELTGNH